MEKYTNFSNFSVIKQRIDIINFLQTFHSEPVHNGDPISEFLPVQSDEVHFVDVTKDGLKSGVNPNQEANDLWARIEQAYQEANEDASRLDHEEL